MVVAKLAKELEAPVRVVTEASTLNTLAFGVETGVVPTPITVEAGVGMQILLIL